MVLHSVDGNRCAFDLPGESTQISMQFGLKIGNNQAGTILSAEDDVGKKVSECSTHAALCRPLTGA